MLVVAREDLESHLQLGRDVVPRAIQLHERVAAAERLPSERTPVGEFEVLGEAAGDAVPVASVDEASPASGQPLGFRLCADLLEASERGVGVVALEDLEVRDLRRPRTTAQATSAISNSPPPSARWPRYEDAADERAPPTRQQLASTSGPGRARSCPQDLNERVAPVEFAPADEPPVDERSSGAKSWPQSVPVAFVVGERYWSMQLAHRRVSGRGAGSRAQLLEAGQRGRLVAIGEQLLIVHPAVADPADEDEVVLHGPRPGAGRRVAMPAGTDRDVAVVTGERLEPNLDVRDHLGPGPEKIGDRMPPAQRVPLSARWSTSSWSSV